MKILVLDDDMKRLETFKKNIETHLDCELAVYCSHSKDAIDALKEDDFSYIFLDHDLSDVQMDWDEDNSGMTVVDWMIKNKYTRKTNIVVHSWNIMRGQLMTKRLRNAGYPVIHQPGIWNYIGF